MPHRLVMASPIGRLELVESDGALVRIGFDAGPDAAGEEPGVVLVEAHRQLRDYFAGRRRTFDLPLAPQGTEFQRRVWAHLQTIPYGRTTTYGALARDLDLPHGWSRAVGSANAANPLPVVVPCHRVVGADGTLTGYAGGLDRKRILLRLEGVPLPEDQDSLF